MKKLLLAAMICAGASGASWSKGPAPNLESAQAAVAKAGDSARKYAKDISAIPVEMAGVLTVQHFADEPNGGKDAAIRRVVAAKLKYWEENLAALKTARQTALDKRRGGSEVKTLSEAQVEIRAVFSLDRQTKAAQAVVDDTELDLDYLAQRPERRGEDRQQLIDRKARLYTRLSALTKP